MADIRKLTGLSSVTSKFIPTSKVTPTPTRPHLLIVTLPIGQVFMHTSLLGLLLFKQSHLNYIFLVYIYKKNSLSSKKSCLVLTTTCRIPESYIQCVFSFTFFPCLISESLFNPSIVHIFFFYLSMVLHSMFYFTSNNISEL